MNWSWIPDTFRFGSKDRPFFSRYSLFSASANFNDYGSDLKKLKKVLENPALLKIWALQGDMYSLGKPYVYKKDKVVDDIPFTKMMKAPNPFQDLSQFQWDYMFWLMQGNAYLYVTSKVVDSSTKMYWLNPMQMEWPDEFRIAKDKIILTQASLKALDKLSITYRYQDGTSMLIPWSNIIHYSDLSNGSGNWFKGNSRLDAICKIIDNSEAALTAKNINVEFSGKFLVAGKNDIKDITKKPLTPEEQKDIEEKTLGRKTVHALKSLADIQRFVSDMGALKLDEAYLADYFLMGTMYNIPRDVLEAYVSSTYENQEKARGAHVSYSLEPKSFYGKLGSFFGYDDKGKDIKQGWDHLPFMWVFDKDRSQTNFFNSRTILNLQRAGVPVGDINKMLDIELTELKPQQQNQNNGDQQQADTSTTGGQQGQQ